MVRPELNFWVCSRSYFKYLNNLVFKTILLKICDNLRYDDAHIFTFLILAFDSFFLAFEGFEANDELCIVYYYNSGL